MAKKMQRLDESPDFRPFKFRIQAFTNAFLEEVGRLRAPRGFPIPGFTFLLLLFIFSSRGKDILRIKYP
jgi:hypothetical protein